LCHFLLDAHFEADDQVSLESKLYLIDLHRIQMRRKTPERWAVKDIAGLYYSSKEIGLTKRDLLRFMRLYRGKPLREILATETSFWRKVESRGNKLYESEKRKALVLEKLRSQQETQTQVIEGDFSEPQQPRKSEPHPGAQSASSLVNDTAEARHVVGK